MSTTSAASFAERADIFCAVDSVSFFVSPLALCVSRIISLGKLMDTSSANLRAPLVETGSRTWRSLGTMWFLIHLVRKVRWLA